MGGARARPCNLLSTKKKIFLNGVVNYRFLLFKLRIKECTLHRNGLGIKDDSKIYRIFRGIIRIKLLAFVETPADCYYSKVHTYSTIFIQLRCCKKNK